MLGSNITILTLDQIIANIQAAVIAVYGTDIDLSPDSPEGQLIALIAESQYQLYQLILAVYQSQSVPMAQGQQLDNLMANIDIKRQAGTYSVIPGVTLSGTNSTVIPAGSLAQTSSGNLFHSAAEVTISGGTATVDFISNTVGAITVNSGDLNVKVSGPDGWTSVTNPNPATPGQAIEKDAQLRRDQLNLINQFGLGYIGTIKAAVFNVDVPSINDVYVLENDSTGTLPGPLAVPANSMLVNVDYNDRSLDQTIAEAIFRSKSACGTYADSGITVVSKTVTDDSGFPHTVEFNKANQTQLYVIVNLNQISKFGEPVTNLVKNALIEFVSTNARIGGLLVYTKMLASIADLDTSILIESMYVGTSPTPTTNVDLLATNAEIFYLIADNITVEVNP